MKIKTIIRLLHTFQSVCTYNCTLKKRPNVTYAEKLFIFVLKKLSKCIKCFIILKKCFGIVSASQLHITLKLKNPYYMYLLFITSFIWLGRLNFTPISAQMSILFFAACISSFELQYNLHFYKTSCTLIRTQW